MLLSSVHGADRLESLRPISSPATAYANSRSSQITVPNFNPIVDEYKNLRKSSPPYGSATVAAPLLHKAQYSGSSYTANQTPHHDIIPIVKHSSEPNNGDGSYSFR